MRNCEYKRRQGEYDIERSCMNEQFEVLRSVIAVSEMWRDITEPQ